MGIVQEVREKILLRRYEFSKHAVDQSIIREISVTEVEEAISGNSEIIVDYPDDKYGPSLPVLGFTNTGRPLHIQCSYPARLLLKIITIYEPNPDLWVNCNSRKPT
jgi:hypothetical protein